MIIRFQELFENHFGDARVVRAIGGANYQQVLAGGETAEIEGELFVLRIDYAVHL